MNSTRVRDLVAIAVVAGVAAWLLARTFYGSIPPVNLMAGASLYAVAAVLVVLAFVIRGRVTNHSIGDGPDQLHPIVAARAAALAKASSVVGAAWAGVWGGLLVHVLTLRSTIRAAAEDTPGTTVSMIAGIVLVAAALWLEHCCRTPSDPDEPAT